MALSDDVLLLEEFLIHNMNYILGYISYSLRLEMFMEICPLFDISCVNRKF